MTQEEYDRTDWCRGNMVRLSNGKEYRVCGLRKNCLLLHSVEYDAHFVAYHNIIDSRTYDGVLTAEEASARFFASLPEAPTRRKRLRITITKPGGPEKVVY